MKIETRRKYTRSFFVISFIAYIIAFFIKIIGDFLGIEQFILMKGVLIFVVIGAICSGAVGMLTSGFSLRRLIHDLSPSEIARRKRRRKELHEKRKSQMYSKEKGR